VDRASPQLCIRCHCALADKQLVTGQGPAPATCKRRLMHCHLRRGAVCVTLKCTRGRALAPSLRLSVAICMIYNRFSKTSAAYRYARLGIDNSVLLHAVVH
jgi:hypothetical protein